MADQNWDMDSMSAPGGIGGMAPGIYHGGDQMGIVVSRMDAGVILLAVLVVLAVLILFNMQAIKRAAGAFTARFGARRAPMRGRPLPPLPRAYPPAGRRENLLTDADLEALGDKAIPDPVPMTPEEMAALADKLQCKSSKASPLAVSQYHLLSEMGSIPVQDYKSDACGSAV